MRGLKPKHLFWFLKILFLSTILLGTFVQPLYSQENKLEKAKKLVDHAYPLCWGGFVMVGDPG